MSISSIVEFLLKTDSLSFLLDLLENSRTEELCIGVIMVLISIFQYHSVPQPLLSMITESVYRFRQGISKEKTDRLVNYLLEIIEFGKRSDINKVWATPNAKDVKSLLKLNGKQISRYVTENEASPEVVIERKVSTPYETIVKEESKIEVVNDTSQYTESIKTQVNTNLIKEEPTPSVKKLNKDKPKSNVLARNIDSKKLHKISTYYNDLIKQNSTPITDDKPFLKAIPELQLKQTKDNPILKDIHSFNKKRYKNQLRETPASSELKKIECHSPKLPEFIIPAITSLNPINTGEYAGNEDRLYENYMDVDISNKKVTEGKQARNLLGLGMIEVTGLRKVTGCNTLRKLVEWYVTANSPLRTYSLVLYALASTKRTEKFLSIVHLIGTRKMGYKVNNNYMY